MIESTHLSPQQQQMADLLKITSKLLQRPGMQREVVSVMMEDPEVNAYSYLLSCTRLPFINKWQACVFRNIQSNSSHAMT